MGKFIDLTGKRFGKLLVIKRVEDYISKSGYHQVRWLCKCDCGNELITMGNSLKNGKTISCGCYRSEIVSKTMKDYNTYNLTGEYGIGYTSKGEEFWFDLEDYDKIKDYCWRINNQGYVVGRDADINKDIRFHRVVTNCPDNMFVDHIHGELTRYDNRKSNLRICMHCENKRNVNIQSNNTSGATGVGWDKANNKWIAYITVNQKMINLGRFSNFDDAVSKRIEAENKYFGEFSYRNSQLI